MQEVSVALWRSFDRYDASGPFATWMYRIALNVAISFFRSEERRAARITTVPAVPEQVESAQEDRRVSRLLECIDEPGPLDKALVLMHLDGYSHVEIAGVLGITPTNAATKLGRIKDRLRLTITGHAAQGAT